MIVDNAVNLPMQPTETNPAPATAKRYYVLKVKGKAKIPDYIQVRDEQFTLIGYFRPGRNQRTSTGGDQSELFARIEAAASGVPFGVVTPVDV